MAHLWCKLFKQTNLFPRLWLGTQNLLCLLTYTSAPPHPLLSHYNLLLLAIFHLYTMRKGSLYKMSFELNGSCNTKVIEKSPSDNFYFPSLTVVVCILYIVRINTFCIYPRALHIFVIQFFHLFICSSRIHFYTVGFVLFKNTLHE